MFDNVGGKIKAVAIIQLILGCIGSIVLAAILADAIDEWSSLIGLVGIAVSIVNAFLLYGLGQLVENSDEIVTLMKCNRADQQSRVSTDVSDVSEEPQSENDITDITNETFDFDLLPDFESKPNGFKLNEQWQIAIGCMDSDTIYDRYKNEAEFHPDYRYLCYVELKKRMRGREKKDYLTAVPLKNSDGENESGEDEFFDVICPYCNKQLSFLKGTEEGLCLNCNSIFKNSDY